MSVLADLAEVATKDNTVRLALLKFHEDPELDAYTMLVALVTQLAAEKSEMADLLAQWYEVGKEVKAATKALGGKSP